MVRSTRRYTERLQKSGDAQGTIAPFGKMQVPVTIYADDELVRAMEEQVYQQAANVAGLPGIVKASYAMPDAHWGYGFPIGGGGGFDPHPGGEVSAAEMDDMLLGGAVWAVEQGYGTRADLVNVEENGRMVGAEPRYVSDHAKERQGKEDGQLGSGPHSRAGAGG